MVVRNSIQSPLYNPCDANSLTTTQVATLSNGTSHFPVPKISINTHSLYFYLKCYTLYLH
jgi:hypothetical protein